MLDSADADHAYRQAFIEKDMCAKALGIRFEPAAPGQTCARMVVRPDMVNSHGTCHGGMIFALADAVFAVACNSRNRAAVAQFCSIGYMRAATVGDELTAVGMETVQAGQRGVFDITVSCGDTVVAAFRGHCRAVEPAPSP